MTFGLRMGMVTIGLIVFFLAIGTLQRPPVESIQRGYRGLGMVELYHPATLLAEENANRIPEASPKQDPTGQLASQVYSNVQVLKDVDAGEFIRLMTDITAWVSPQQGCGYCHAEGEDLGSDKLYTKVVSRRMIEMTRHINADWQKHVGETGVTCFTCHRGQPVPEQRLVQRSWADRVTRRRGKSCWAECADRCGWFDVAALRSIHAFHKQRRRSARHLDDRAT